MGAAGSVPAYMSREEAREFAGARWCRVAALWPGDAEVVSREEVLSMMALLRWDDIPVGEKNPLSLAANAELLAKDDVPPRQKVVPPRRHEFDVAGHRRRSIAQSNGIETLQQQCGGQKAAAMATKKLKQQRSSEEFRMLVRAQKKLHSCASRRRQVTATSISAGSAKLSCPESEI